MKLVKGLLSLSMLISATSYSEPHRLEESEIYEELSYSFRMSGSMPAHMADTLNDVTKTRSVAEALGDLVSAPTVGTVQGNCTQKLCDVKWTEKNTKSGTIDQDYGLGVEIEIISVKGNTANTGTTETTYHIKVPCSELKSVVELLRKKD